MFVCDMMGRPACIYTIFFYICIIPAYFERTELFSRLCEKCQPFQIQSRVNHFILKNDSIKKRNKMPSIAHENTTPFKKATFGMGCFWACDALFGAQQGVLRTRVGYSGGTTLDPVYKKMGDHTEVIEIDYDPKTICYEDLLALFWDNHEYGLTTIVKRQYMSLILYHNEDQKRIAEISLKKEAHKRNEKLVTEIAPAGAFYPAEDYHQKYRLQEHSWLCEDLGLTPELLQSSHVAARLNGYLVGVGKEEDYEKDVVKLGLSDKIADYVRRHLKENEGGNLYC